MKNILKIFGLMALLNLPMLMKSQILNPLPFNNTTGCLAQILIKEYGSNCAFITSQIVPVPAGGTSISLNSLTFEIEVTVQWVGTPSCPVTQVTGPVNSFQCGTACSPANPFSNLKSIGGCCPAHFVNVSCGTGNIN